MQKNRRAFLRFAARTLAVVPVAAVLTPSVAGASDMPQLAEDDPTAMALGYVHNADDVDQSKWTRFEAGQNCANCNLIQGDEGEWRGCPIFAGKAVNAAGWCSAWVPKP